MPHILSDDRTVTICKSVLAVNLETIVKILLILEPVPSLSRLGTLVRLTEFTVNTDTVKSA